MPTQTKHMSWGIEVAVRTHQTHRRELLQTLDDLRGRIGAHEPDCVCDFFEDLSEPNRFLWTEWWARPDLVEEAMESSRFHTLLAAAGDPNVKEDLLKGKRVGDMTYKVHLDGYNLMPAFKGEAEWPRHEFLYWIDDGNVAALRYNNWKVTFLRQNAHGMHVWSSPYEQLRMPMIGNLRSDPFERAYHEGIGYPQWQFEHMFMFAPAGYYVGKWLQSFRDFPPRQKPGSFSLDRVLEAITKGAGDK